MLRCGPCHIYQICVSWFKFWQCCYVDEPEGGAFAFFLWSHHRVLDWLICPQPGKFDIQNLLMPGPFPGGAVGTARNDWCITGKIRSLDCNAVFAGKLCSTLRRAWRPVEAGSPYPHTFSPSMSRRFHRFESSHVWLNLTKNAASSLFLIFFFSHCLTP